MGLRIWWLLNIRKLFVWCRYKFSGYGIGFDRHGTFSAGNRFGKNVIIFGTDMSSSVNFDNKGKDILILGDGSTQGLNDTTLTAEKSIQSILQSIIESSV